MEIEEFRKSGHELVDWMADYLGQVENYPVKAQVNPGEILSKLQEDPPEEGASFGEIMKEFESQVLPGITHWQSPSFFAYFPAASSPPSVLAEMLTATLGAQCMVWETSPAATEMEERVMDWLKEMMDLPRDWSGVIQDTASTATLVALLTAREQLVEGNVNLHGFPDNHFRIYCSSQAHSSVDKAVRIAGFGSENLVKVEVDDAFAMKTDALERAIEKDRAAGMHPLAVVGALGTTGSTAIDPIDEIAEIARKYNCWYHIDAAYAGTAFLLKDFRARFRHLDLADSFVFNPHKWMLTNFDCTAYFVKNKAALIDTFELTPEYLKTKEESRVNNYKDWGIQLGRRFRALKLWMVIKSYGVDAIRQQVARHVELGQWFASQVDESDSFELLAPVPLNTVCFRFCPEGKAEEELNALNEQLLHTINDAGSMYFTHTVLNGKYTLRMVTGTTYVEHRHVAQAWELIQSGADKLV